MKSILKSFSESILPDQLLRFINIYLSGMTKQTLQFQTGTEYLKFLLILWKNCEYFWKEKFLLANFEDPYHFYTNNLHIFSYFSLQHSRVWISISKAILEITPADHKESSIQAASWVFTHRLCNPIICERLSCFSQIENSNKDAIAAAIINQHAIIRCFISCWRFPVYPVIHLWNSKSKKCNCWGLGTSFTLKNTFLEQSLFYSCQLRFSKTWVLGDARFQKNCFRN